MGNDDASTAYDREIRGMGYRNLAVLDAAERAEDMINALIDRSPRRLLSVGQMRRSASAIGSNIREGIGRGGEGDKRRSYEVACGEAEETIGHLNTNFRARRIDAKAYWPVHNLLTVIVKMLTNLPS